MQREKRPISLRSLRGFPINPDDSDTSDPSKPYAQSTEATSFASNHLFQPQDQPGILLSALLSDLLFLAKDRHLSDDGGLSFPRRARLNSLSVQGNDDTDHSTRQDQIACKPFRPQMEGILRASPCSLKFCSVLPGAQESAE